MATDQPSVAHRLDRIRALLAGLPGPLGNGELHAWANPGDVDGMHREVFGLIGGLDVGRYPDDFVNVLDSPNDLADRLSEIDEADALQRLISIASSTLAYHLRGRYDETKARSVFGSLLRLLGHGTRWWTNTDFPAWKPVTPHVFDAVVIGVGNGITVTVLAFDED
ncbi:hypothetical protein [Actinomadura fibrosa]|uniref:Uncharacterized protein n=1 Tax=Actinomadura fibrosa TaxID=111802 RepID=A0ABW2XUG4_9ACTN|nr:hypothetical protein [Actinomadura fibrosa]